MEKQPLSFVNINGQKIIPPTGPKKSVKRAVKDESEGWHRGWRVEGIPPGALEEAEADHPRKIEEAKAWNERVQLEKGIGKAIPIPGPFDPDRWLNEAKPRPVRSKSYEVEDSALQCKRIAEKSGWLRVSVRELKKEPNRGH